MTFDCGETEIGIDLDNSQRIRVKGDDGAHVKVCAITFSHTGFSLSFKVDRQDVKVGRLAIKCCRQFKIGGFHSLTLYPFSPKSRRLRPYSSWPVF